MLPVRCYTCNKVLGHLDTVLAKYKYDTKDQDVTLEPFFQQHRIERYCCRRILLCHVHVHIPTISNHEKDELFLHHPHRLPRDDDVVSVTLPSTVTLLRRDDSTIITLNAI